MPSADGPGSHPALPDPTQGPAADLVHSQLIEALMHLLIEKGVLTKNDALSVVGTVAQVQQGVALEARSSAAGSQANLQMLQDLYRSFEAVTDRLGAPQSGLGNVHRLRTPVHGDRPEFPRDD